MLLKSFKNIISPNARSGNRMLSNKSRIFLFSVDIAKASAFCGRLNESVEQAELIQLQRVPKDIRAAQYAEYRRQNPENEVVHVSRTEIIDEQSAEIEQRVKKGAQPDIFRFIEHDGEHGAD